MPASAFRRSATDVIDVLNPGMTVFIPGMSGESLAIYDALRANPERADRVTFVGVHFPGVNNTDYLGLYPTVRLRAYFMSPTIRAHMAGGRIDLMPLDYPGIVRDIEDHLTIDAAIAQVSLPDDRGFCSLGTSHDFLPSAWQKARIRIAHINPRLPRVAGSFQLKLDDCEFAFECDSAIPSVATAPPDDALLRHARIAANLVVDGATLQFGVGRLQAAILRSLRNHRDLRVYSGMVSAPILNLLESGAIRHDCPVECGVALGDADFYASLDRDLRFYFRPARETHDLRRLASIPNFCAINSALEVDLVGQVNVDSVNGRLSSGMGGLPVFASAARLSPGGRSIIILPSTANDGQTSRIVCKLEDCLVAVPRHDADYVVTEYGVAQLRGLSVHERALAMISIAAPQFRSSLEEKWRAVASTL